MTAIGRFLPVKIWFFGQLTDRFMRKSDLSDFGFGKFLLGVCFATR